MAQRRPTLVMIAGPNGAGKSTFSRDLRARSWFRDFVDINPDVIAEERFGDWNSPSARSRAALLAANMASTALQKCIEYRHRDRAHTQRHSASRARQSQWLPDKVLLIATSDPAINITRVADRVDRGGHTIDTDTIVRRYHEAIAALPDALEIADHGHVYDNSLADTPPRQLYRSRNGNFAKRYQDDIPDWAKEGLQRIQSR